jgi:hypothetical protein
VTGPSMTSPDHDQVPRLLRFREAHPDVTIAFGGPFWQAIIPEVTER